ncbi:MAG TPA: hypothetical protein DFI01_08555 [Bacteroidales bacterium]|nr:hypothetical protein [Bacteroidales bacterium]
MDGIRVSVIIPSFNSSHCIENALKSVINQTFKNFEVLVCDDGSTDQTKEIVRAYQKNDPRIKLLCLAENQGSGAARNIGMSYAKGDYIAFLDSDDEWFPDKLKHQVERMDNLPKEVGVCFCGAIIIKNGRNEKPIIYSPDKDWETDTFEKFALDQITFLTSTVLFRRSCLEESGLMIPQMRRNQDGEFFLRLFYNYGLTVIPKLLAVIKINTSSKRRYYQDVKKALPYRMSHEQIIKKRLGYWNSKYYLCLKVTNLLSVAIREHLWREALSAFYMHLKILPIFSFKEIKMILRALARSLIFKGV